MGQLLADHVRGEQVDQENRLAAGVDGLAGELAGEDSSQDGEAGSAECEREDEKDDGHGVTPCNVGFASDGHHDTLATL